MAALNEADLVKILGADFRALQEKEQTSRGIFEEERALNTKIESQDGNLFTAAVLMIVGIALLVSTHYTATGNQYWIQGAFGVLSLVGGIALYIYLKQSLVKLRAKGAILHAANKAAPVAA